jgi:hypothetical protein
VQDTSLWRPATSTRAADCAAYSNAQHQFGRLACGNCCMHHVCVISGDEQCMLWTTSTGVLRCTYPKASKLYRKHTAAAAAAAAASAAVDVPSLC